MGLKKKLLLGILTTLATVSCPPVHAGSAVIFSGSDVKALKSNLDLNGSAKILSGSSDPSIVATSAPRGSLYLNNSNASVYRKTDNGSSTNWSLLVGSSSVSSLTGDVTGTGPGATATTVAFVGGSSAANVHNAELLANASTDANTANAIVKRDGSGNFSAGTITAALTGNVVGNLTGNVTGNVSGNAGTVTTNANLTGPITSVGNATSVASQTGTGSTFVMQASPTLTTPVIGAATGTSLSVSGQLTSTVSTGTAPLVVSSTTQVANLNAATSGTATNATNGATVATTTNASFFPLFAASSSNSNQPFNLGTGLTFNPSTNNLSTTTFTGALTGTASGNVPNTLLTTKGDLHGFSSVNARIPVGSNDQVLMADSAQTLGVKWATIATAGVSPTVQKFTSGSGTYTTPAGVHFIRVRMVGGGGGGGGSGTASAGTGGTGGITYFRVGASPDLLVANGGVGGVGANLSADGGLGGTASLGTGPIGTALKGANGGGGGQNSNSGSSYVSGGMGGASPFGGAGGSSGYTNNQTIENAVANSGSGGGGAVTGPQTNADAGGGGGAGGFVDAIINSPNSTYSYSVGISGTAGTAGTNGFAGGTGGSGYIEVTEYYTALAVGTSAAVTANYVMAGPTSGAAASPTFRALVNADIPAVTHRVRVTTGNGQGSTNTVIRRYSVVEINQGTAITYADSAANGASFTINEPGIYTVHRTEDGTTAARGFGLSISSNQLTTAIQSITAANFMTMALTGTSNGTTPSGALTFTFRAAANDVIRPHDSGSGCDKTYASIIFDIMKIGN